MLSMKKLHKQFDLIVQRIVHMNMLKNIRNDDPTVWLLTQNIVFFL